MTMGCSRAELEREFDAYVARGVEAGRSGDWASWADQFTSFPIEWAVFDEERGWIVCEVQNRLTDPGDGSIFQASNFTRLVYAGDGMWSYEEDVYNPQSMADAMQAWAAHRRTLRDSS